MRPLRCRLRRNDPIEAENRRTGMGAKFWADRKATADERMAAIDESPPAWRNLVNEFGLEPVVVIAKRAITDARVARLMLERMRMSGG